MLDYLLILEKILLDFVIKFQLLDLQMTDFGMEEIIEMTMGSKDLKTILLIVFSIEKQEKSLSKPIEEKKSSTME